MMTQWQYNPYVFILAIAALISATLAFLALRRRPARGATVLALLMLAAYEWSVGYVMELGSVNLRDQIFWAKVQYLGIVSVPLLWLILSVQYTGRERWLSRRNLALLAIVPFLTLGLVWTNEFHGLIWRQIDQTTIGSSVLLDLTYGGVFWLYFAFSYVLLLAGSILIVQALVSSPELYRGQASTLLAGVLIPWVGNLLYVTGLSPFARLDLTPFAFTLSGLALAGAILRYRLLDIVPVARDTVIEGMDDGMFVLDVENRVIDVNPAAERAMGRSRAIVVGKPMGQALPGVLVDLVQRRRAGEGYAEITLGEGAERRIYEVRISALYGRQNRLSGRLVVLHDITQRKRAEEALQRRALQLQTAAEVSRDAAGVHDLSELLNRIVGLIRDRFGFYHAGVFLLDEAGEYAVLQAAASEGGRRMLARGHRLKVGETGIVGYVTRSGEPRIALDVGEDAVFFDNPDLPATRSEMALPLRVRGRVIGALDVQSRQPAAFDENDVTTLQTMADQLALAIERARLFEEMELAMHELEMAYAQTTEEAWRTVARRSDRPQGYRYRRLSLEPVGGQTPEALRAWQQGQTVVGDGSSRGIADGRGAATAVAVPIKLRDQVIGVLNLRSARGPISAEVIAFAEEVAGRLALAMENARLLEGTRQRAARDRMVTEIATRMRGTLDLDTVMRSALEGLSQAAGGAQVTLRMGDAETLLEPLRAASSDEPTTSVGA
jgi:PAS domain S-box-containing protein